MRTPLSLAVTAAFIAAGLPLTTVAAATATEPTTSASSGGLSMTTSWQGFEKIEAESYSWASGSPLKQPSGDVQDPNNQGLALLHRGDAFSYDGVTFGADDATSVELRLSSAVNTAGGTIDIRRGDASGEVVGSVLVPKTASWQDYKTVSVPLSPALTGTTKITLTLTAADGNPFVNLNWLRFGTGAVAPPVSPSQTPSPTSASPTPTSPSPSPTPTVSTPGHLVASRIEAESYTSATGDILKQPSGDSADPHNLGLSLLRRGTAVSYDSVALGAANANAVNLRLSSAVNAAGGTIQVRRGGADGTVVGSLVVATTGSWQDYKTVSVPLTETLTGTQRISLTFASGDGNPFVNLNWLEFTSASPVPSPTSGSPTPSPTTASPTPSPSPTSATPTPSPTSASPTPAPTQTQPADPGGWNLLWSDEFNAPAGSAPDSSKWGYDIGSFTYDGAPGWGNHELQYYTDSRENSALTGDGNLAITAKNNGLGNTCWYGPCTHTSAKLTTEHKFNAKYGKVEARIKIPQGQGIWPAFWMMGNDYRTVGWPNNGEIDIMENVGKEPSTLYGNIHGPGYSGCCGIVGSTTLPNGKKLADEFHTYGIEWDADGITWYLDGKPFHRATKSDLPAGSPWVFDHEFFILLNVAVGGQWPGSPDQTTVFPQQMLVDYVRVYEPTGASSGKPAGSRIEAEVYDSQSGVGRQATEDVDGGGNIGWLANGDWAAYKRVDFGSAGYDKVNVRLANGSQLNGTVEVRLGSPTGERIATVSAASTGGWQQWQTREAQLTRRVSGQQDVYLAFSNPTTPADFVNVNWFHFTDSGSPAETPAPAPTSASPSPVPTPTSASPSPVPTPTSASPSPVPTPQPISGFGRIEAENYSAATGPILKQPSGDSADVHNPGLALLRRENTLTYNAVNFGSATASAVDVRVSSAANPAGGAITVRRGGADGAIVGSATVPTTASWQDFRTVRVPLNMALTGSQNITLTFQANDGNPFVNLNWLEFVGAGTAPTATPTPIPSPTESTSSPTPLPSPTVSPTPAPVPPVTVDGMIVKFVNNTGQPDSNVFVTADSGGVGNPVYTGSVGNKFQPGLGRGVALTELTGPGTNPAAHTYTFVIHGQAGGRIYYSFNQSFTQHWPHAADTPMAYDIAEFFTLGNSDFFGDLSAVDQVGIPSNMQLLDSNGNVLNSAGEPASRDIACHADVLGELAANAPAGWDYRQAAIYDADGSLLRLVAPNAAPERHPSLRPYVESLRGQTLRVRGRYAGGPGAGAGAYYDYSATIDAEGNVYLRGTLTDPDDPSKPNAAYPQPKSMYVKAGDLYGAETPGYTGWGIYQQNGPYTLNGVVTGDGATSPWKLVTGSGTTDSVRNDIYGWIYGDLVTAYAYGYWGGKYGNDSSAFHGKPAFGDARVSPSPWAAWSLWQQAIWNTSDSYGMSLGERFDAAGKKSPLIGIANGVQTMQVTLKRGCGAPANASVSTSPLEQWPPDVWPVACSGTQASGTSGCAIPPGEAQAQSQPSASFQLQSVPPMTSTSAANRPLAKTSSVKKAATKKSTAKKKATVKKKPAAKHMTKVKKTAGRKG